MISVGQSRRVDIVTEMQEILGSYVEIWEAGALSEGVKIYVK